MFIFSYIRLRFYLLAIILIILCILYYVYKTPGKKHTPAKNITERSQIMCIYSDNCIHSRNLLSSGKLDEVQQYFRDQSIPIDVVKIDIDKRKEIQQQFNVEYLPDLRIISDNGKVVPYKGAYDTQQIISFAKENINL